ncbi:MAG: ECF transporter S component [Clostridia bacterium]|nr:ECF transporter S component [Clostridia bacterium]
MTNSNDKIRKIIAMALFTAVAYIFGILPSIKVNFLSLDIKDAFIAIGALYLGPTTGVVVSAVVSVMETIFGSTTGFYGLIMNFLGSAAFAAVASLIYTNKKSLANAIISLAFATISMTLIMLVANLIFTPYYMGVEIQMVKDLLIPLFLPFNLVKGILNSALVMMFYKPISVALKKARLSTGTTTSVGMNKNTVIIFVISLVIVVLSFVFIFFKLDGVLAIPS